MLRVVVDTDHQPVDVVTVYRTSKVQTFPSEDHSEHEARFLTIGESTKEELLVVAHTEEDDIIRIINARMATRQERRFYEKGKPSER